LSEKITKVHQGAGSGSAKILLLSCLAFHLDCHRSSETATDLPAAGYYLTLLNFTRATQDHHSLIYSTLIHRQSAVPFASAERSHLRYCGSKSL
ncbi:hypothetical protein BS17DRAFT_806209, partial [Gyrodon lividus]